MANGRRLKLRMDDRGGRALTLVTQAQWSAMQADDDDDGWRALAAGSAAAQLQRWFSSKRATPQRIQALVDLCGMGTASLNPAAASNRVSDQLRDGRIIAVERLNPKSDGLFIQPPPQHVKPASPPPKEPEDDPLPFDAYIEVRIDPNDPASQALQFILTSSGGEEHRKTVAADIKKGDRTTTLLQKNLPATERYSLRIHHPAQGDDYYLFRHYSSHQLQLV